ncbi:MAG: alpha/beta hydrolase [Gammaproteobacteria bacterium]|nr:alpha/beta hydrolase [Gammaproteobacteria bacterium]
MQDMLERPTGDAKLPEGFVGKIAAWLGEGRAAAGTPVPAALQTIDMPWRGKGLRETFTRVAGLAALLSTPRDARLDTVVVFLNSGAEPHIGPGRAWVEYARALASRGHACLRTDFSGWGESPDEGHRPGRPYDEHCVPDTLRIVAALRGRYRRIVLAGLCAGAWVALKAAQQIRVDGVFALNPQLYWKPGLPVIIRDPEAFEWRTPMRERHRKAARWQLWSFLDLLGIRPMAAHWLTALRKNRTRVILSFAAGDDGLVFLRDRCARRLARELRCGYLTVEETAGIDHQMYRLWMRPAIVEQMAHFLEALPATPDDGVKIKP